MNENSANKTATPPTIYLSTASSPPVLANVALTPLDSSARTKAALKSLALFWLLSVVSIALPIAHFVLVPGFFVAGIVFALGQYKRQWRLEAGNVACPECRQNISLKERAAKFPLSETCPNCKTVVTLTEQAPGTTSPPIK